MTTQSDDPFDPFRLRLDQHFQALVSVKKLLTQIPVRKPDKQKFFRVHPDSTRHIKTTVIELKEYGEYYLVEPELRVHLIKKEIIQVVLYSAITRQNDFFLWPIKLPGSDGRTNSWVESELWAVNEAMKGWVRIQSNKSIRGYEVFLAQGALGEPQWPELSFGEILTIAFRDRVIDRIDHPVLKRLRGEI